jgi:hypothetical protein
MEWITYALPGGPHNQRHLVLPETNLKILPLSRTNSVLPRRWFLSDGPGMSPRWDHPLPLTFCPFVVVSSNETEATLLVTGRILHGTEKRIITHLLNKTYGEVYRNSTIKQKYIIINGLENRD